MLNSFEITQTLDYKSDSLINHFAHFRSFRFRFFKLNNKTKKRIQLDSAYKE